MGRCGRKWWWWRRVVWRGWGRVQRGRRRWRAWRVGGRWGRGGGGRGRGRVREVSTLLEAGWKGRDGYAMAKTTPSSVRVCLNPKPDLGIECVGIECEGERARE